MAQKEEIDIISKMFMESLMKNVSDDDVRKRREYLILNVVPCLIPAIISLLKAVETNEKKKQKGGDVLPIKPIHYLAKYLYRHNPKHGGQVEETKQLEKLSKMLMDC